MRQRPQAPQPELPLEFHKSPDFSHALRKHRRKLGWIIGRRHQQTNADAYYALLRRDHADFEALITHYEVATGRHRDARRLARNIRADIRRLESNARQIATGLILQHRIAIPKRYLGHAVAALTAIVMYAYKTGYCNAEQQSLADRAIMSRAAISGTWIPKFIEAGIIQHVGYDWRSRRTYGNGQTASNFTNIYAVPHLITQVDTNFQDSGESRAAANLAPIPARQRGSNGDVSAANIHHSAAPSQPRPPPGPDIAASSSTAPPPPRRYRSLTTDFPKPGEWAFEYVVAAARYENPYGLSPDDLDWKP